MKCLVIDGVTFHQRLHCLLRQKLSSEKQKYLYLEIIICHPLNHTMTNPKFTVSNQKEDSISIYRVNPSAGCCCCPFYVSVVLILLLLLLVCVSLCSFYVWRYIFPGCGI